MQFLLALTLLFSPSYVMKFKLLGLPTDVLMVWVILTWIIFAGWLIIKNQITDFIKSITSLDKKLLILIGLFFLSGAASLFIRGLTQAKLGQFIVLFLQPISIFFIGRYLIQQFPHTSRLLLATCYLLLACAGIYAIIQYFTLIGLPSSWWGNSQEPKRSLSFFIHPNFYALWCTPLLAFLIPDALASLKTKIYKLKTIFWIFGAIGLLLSLSRAGWLGLAAAIAVYLIFAADKKIRKIIFGAIIAMVIIIIAIPNLRWRLILPFYGEKSTDSRIELWQSGWKAVKTSPILGLGLNGYANNYQTFQTDKSLDTHNFPHNIFLNFWVETGLLGLISFVGIVWIYLYNGLKNRQDIIKLGVSLFLIALLIQGQIDNPYFKNDLAIVFWIVLSLFPSPIHGEGARTK